MQRIAKFHKVSFEQFQESWQDTFGQPAEQNVYDNLKLPARATAGSAGYDFFSPLTFSLAPGKP